MAARTSVSAYADPSHIEMNIVGYDEYFRGFAFFPAQERCNRLPAQIHVSVRFARNYRRFVDPDLRGPHTVAPSSLEFSSVKRNKIADYFRPYIMPRAEKFLPRVA
jgi:hypothetical protein